MNLLEGTITEIYIDGGTTMGKVSVRGAFLRVPLTLLPEARVGDTILIESGVAISTIKTETMKEN